MADKHMDPATRMRRLAAPCGVLADLSAVTPAVAEVRQGNGSLDAMVFGSWADGRIATSLGGALIAQSRVMLLVGGGFGPPILGVLAGGVAIGLGGSLRRWRAFDGNPGRRLAPLWTALSWLSAANVVVLGIGSLIVGYVLDVAVPDILVCSLFLAVLVLPFATLAGPARRFRDSSELVSR